MIAVPGPWATSAACNGSTALMVDEHATEAIQICAGCPVLTECRDWALGTPDPARSLVAGGYTTTQRARIRRGQPPGRTRHTTPPAATQPPTTPPPPPPDELPPDPRAYTRPPLRPLPAPTPPAGPDDPAYLDRFHTLTLRLHPAVAAVLAHDDLARRND